MPPARQSGPCHGVWSVAANIGIGRNSAAVHWRSDAGAGLYEAEQSVISLLADERATFREPFAGFRLPASTAPWSTSE